ncbi:FUSC family protein [Paracoccus sp. (in: a-proteobacteria)]|uniref:FUSC family protein n=1 Tax=Paracoccus sp. TaxID=267 RepID=UPI0028A2908B|nr:FUSC family protein [Paracoccus sp. (in: a-proteobacteria)]
MTIRSDFHRIFERLGFDRPKFLQGLQVSSAALIALVLAWLLRLEHPQWAAITVFVTLQPTRGQIIEKSSYRFIGTIIGSGFGTAVAWFAGGKLGIELLALAFWASLMVFIGSLQRSYRSYGTVLAGYSAIIVIVLNPFSPETVREVASDRVLTVLIGALTGVIWAYLARLNGSDHEVQLKARRLTADILHLAGAAQSDAARRDHGAFGRLITAASLLQEELNTLTANGKLARSGRFEPLLPALVNLLFASFQHPPNPALGESLEGAAVQLHGQNDFSGMIHALRKMIARAEDPVVEDALSSLLLALSNLDEERGSRDLMRKERRRYALDWTGAWQGALRIFIVLSCLGLGWVLTQDASFQYALVSAAICMSLATTGVTPTRKMQDVIKGQFAAAAVAIATEMLLWPLFPSPEGQLLSLLPALCSFAFIRSHRGMSLSAPDYAITLFLLLSPSYGPYQISVLPIWKGLMAASGGVLGYLAFFLIFPTDARGRRKALWVMIKRDLQEVAQMRRVSFSYEDWRLSFCARFLKIAHWASLEGGRYEKSAVTMQKAVVAMQLAEVVFLLKRCQHRAGLAPSLRRAIAASLARISVTDKETPRFQQGFARLAHRFELADMTGEARVLTALVDDLTELGQLRKA